MLGESNDVGPFENNIIQNVLENFVLLWIPNDQCG